MQKSQIKEYIITSSVLQKSMLDLLIFNKLTKSLENLLFVKAK